MHLLAGRSDLTGMEDRSNDEKTFPSSLRLLQAQLSTLRFFVSVPSEMGVSGSCKPNGRTTGKYTIAAAATTATNTPEIDHTPHVVTKPHGGTHVRLILANEDGVRHRQQTDQSAVLQEAHNLRLVRQSPEDGVGWKIHTLEQLLNRVLFCGFIIH